MPRRLTEPFALLRIEGAAVFLLAVVLYRELGASWWLFVLLFLLPDVSILAYRAGPRIGARVYNIVHTYVFPWLLFAVGFLAERPLTMALALIWAAHLAIDRLFGFGLKYLTGFKDTHLQRL